MSTATTGMPNTIGATLRQSNRIHSWSVGWAIAVLATVPLLLVYFQNLWPFEHYRFFPMLLLFVGYLTWIRWDRQICPPQGVLGTGLLGLGGCTLLGAGLLLSPWLAAVSLVFVYGAFLYSHREMNGRSLFALWPICWLLIRPPIGLDIRMITELQKLTSRLSDIVLNLLYVPHDVTGNIIKLPSRELFVADACSGVQSLFTLLFIAFAIAAWKRRPIILLPAYLAFAILFALLANVLRVSLIAVASHQFGIDLSTGWQHELVGYMVLCLGIGLLLSADQLLVLLFTPIGSNKSRHYFDGTSTSKGLFSALLTEHEDFVESSSQPTSQAQTQTPGYSKSLALCSTSLFVICGLLACVHWASQATASANLEKIADELDASNMLFVAREDLFGTSVGNFQCDYVRASRTKEDLDLGANSDIWTLQQPSFFTQLVVSQPYDGWHDLTVCYEGIGWTRESYRVVSPNVNGDPASDGIAIAVMRHDDGRYGYLYFSGVNDQGRIERPVWRGFFADLMSRIRYHFSDRRTGSIGVGKTAMLQCWLVSPSPINDQQSAELLSAVDHARQTILKEFQAPAPPSDKTD